MEIRDGTKTMVEMRGQWPPRYGLDLIGIYIYI